ncbi:nucleotidyltransferase family protein [Rhodoferax bucti]|uniref:nucleotidyltransferase family protein n=1 Tax=Rhodoferax bucti TaxID=2576305 RepID=UPI001109DB47|nr:nucleotidyltransferase domain-containing protein [Rhodoferax bucti]
MSMLLEPPIQLSASDWQEVQRVLCQELPHTEIWAFGSRARRTAKLYSDLDLVVVQEQPLSLETLANLRHALDASDLSIRVDVVDWAAISESFRNIIAQDKVLVQPAHPAHHKQG